MEPVEKLSISLADLLGESGVVRVGALLVRVGPLTMRVGPSLCP